MSRLFLGNLPPDVAPREIEDRFRDFGKIVDIVIKPNFGFVEFRDERDAREAMDRMNNRDFMGKRLIIEVAKRPGERRDRERYGGGSVADQGRYRVKVENISSSVRWQDLKDFFMEAGDVAFADCHKIRHGEGIVEFHREEDMRNAIRKLDGRELNGRRVRLTEDGSYRRRVSDRHDRSRSPRGRHRSRSHSPRRSSRRYSRSPIRRGGRSRSPRPPRSPRSPPRRGGYSSGRPRSPPPPSSHHDDRSPVRRSDRSSSPHSRSPPPPRRSPNSANDFNGEPVSPVVDDPFQDTSLKAGSPVAAAAATTTSGWE